MRLKISTQPISTSRSPRKGSRPVVSVSRTISRMEVREPTRKDERDEGESGSPGRQFSSLNQNVANSRADGIKTVRGIHHEMRPLSLLGVGHLPRQNAGELFLGHIGPRQNALALDFRRRRDHDNRIDALFAAGL